MHVKVKAHIERENQWKATKLHSWSKVVRDENVILRHRETKDIYRPFGGRVRWHYEAYVAFEPIGLMV